MRIKKVLTSLLKVAVTIGVLLFVVRKLGWQEILQTVAHAQASWLVAALIVFTVSGVLGVIQWRLILHNRNLPLSFGRAFSLYFMGLFFNNISLGIVAGDAIKIAYIKLAGDGRGTTGFAATFLDRFAGLWTMLGFAVAGCLLLIKQKLIASQSMNITIITLFVMFCMFGMLGAFLLSTRIQKIIFGILEKIPLLNSDRIRAVINETILETRDKHIIVPVALLSIVVQFLRVSVHIFCAASLGLVSAGTVSYFFVLVPVVAMIMIVPLPFGIRESVGGALFAFAGFKVHEAVVMGFLATLVGIVASIVGGIMFLLDNRSLTHRKHVHADKDRS